jgi:hypothetical protein
MTEQYYPSQTFAIHAFCEECGYHPLSHIESRWIDPAIKDASLEAHSGVYLEELLSRILL